MWDTDYKYLSLGIYSALQDIKMMQEKPPFKYYFLGWYIHTCPKMNYKSSFRPCELQCPVTYNYVKFDKTVRNLLDENGYTQLDFENLPVESYESAVFNVPCIINEKKSHFRVYRWFYWI